jgi:hypothetical protein
LNLNKIKGFDMKRILCFVFICFVVQVFSKNLCAQNTAVYEGLTYYLDKNEAFDAATAQDKQVFLFWGSNSCGICNQVKKNMAVASIKPILDEHYILWFCDALVYRWTSPEVSDYLSVLEDNPPYPALCIIDTLDRTKGYGLVTGLQSTKTLEAMLNKYVANDYVNGAEDLCSIYVSQNSLVVNSSITDESINVYTITGLLVDSFRKTEYSTTRYASSYPSGVLLVTGSSGWTRKILMK